MAAGSRARVNAAMAAESVQALRARCGDLPLPPALARVGSFDLIAELKLRSPALGDLGDAGDDLDARVTAYARAGAAAVSVLTEPSRFSGSLEHLGAAAAALAPLQVPAMRKDFLVDPYQLYEARACGAGGALLIVRMLSRELLAEMLDCARELGLFVLIEAFDEADIDAAVEALCQTRLAASGGSLLAPEAESRVARTHRSSSPRLDGSGAGNGGRCPPEGANFAGGRRRPGGAGQPAERATGDRPDKAPAPVSCAEVPGVERAARGDVLLGVNSRDLQTLAVVPERLEQLAPRLPREYSRVAESGLKTPADAARMVRAGYDMALVGGALMSAPDPGSLVAAMLAAGRSAAA
jgi:indole-3-glycerol phosphate synthase